MLISNQVFRTCKFLSAVAAGVEIVTEDWLKACAKEGSFVDLSPFALRDKDREKRFKFVLATSLEASRKKSIFAGYSVYVTAGTVPPPMEMQSKCACFCFALTC